MDEARRKRRKKMERRSSFIPLPENGLAFSTQNRTTKSLRYVISPASGRGDFIASFLKSYSFGFFFLFSLVDMGFWWFRLRLQSEYKKVDCVWFVRVDLWDFLFLQICESCLQFCVLKIADSSLFLRQNYGDVNFYRSIVLDLVQCLRPDVPDNDAIKILRLCSCLHLAMVNRMLHNMMPSIVMIFFCFQNQETNR